MGSHHCAMAMVALVSYRLLGHNEAHTGHELSKYLSMGLPVVIRANMAQAELTPS